MNKYIKELLRLLKENIDPEIAVSEDILPYSIVYDSVAVGKRIHSFGINPFKGKWSVYYQDLDKGGRHQYALCPDERTACAWFIRISNYEYHLAEHLPFFEDKNDPEFVEAMKKVERTSKDDIDGYEVYTDNL